MSLNRTLNIEFKEKLFVIEFPNNRQYLAVQNLKHSLAPKFQQLQLSDPESSFGASLAEAVSFLTVLCPKLKEALLSKDIMDLPLEDGIEIVELYNNTIRPWYDSWLNKLFAPSKQEESQEDTTPNE